MTAPRFDVDAWARATFAIRNLDGGGGYEQGIRKFLCPFCSDDGGHAWVNIETGRLYCFHPGCEANGGMNVVEAVRRLRGFRTWTEALVWARREFPMVGPAPLPALPLFAYEDWCELPKYRLFGSMGLGSSLEAKNFVVAQWGLSCSDAVRWRLGFCTVGRYAWRLIIPVTMGGRLVAFQARSYRNGEPKYLTSKWGKRGEPEAECGRPAEALLFGLDDVKEGNDVVVVEGAGDAMRWEAKVLEGGNRGTFSRGIMGRDNGLLHERITAVALLGTALTDEKAALLVAKRPGRVIVALDAGAEQERVAVAGKLAAWGLETALGAWVGGKDAGSGARLELVGGGSLRDRVAGRMGR